jgi:DNA-binding CsgD family transcriptional regulator
MHLLEREACLQRLEDALGDALGGDGRVVLVSGEAGIGKTSLIRSFTRRQSRSPRVLWGACDPQFTPRPLGPVHDMAGQLAGPVPRQLAARADRSTVFHALLDELRSRPTIAVFEDVHWADDATLDLLAYLSRRLASSSTMLVLTYRDDELGPSHPLRVLLGDLATSPIIRRVVPQPLSEDAVRRMAETRVDAAAVHRRTAGNPFFVTEVLANADLALPPTVRDAVLARAARLSPVAQEVLLAAAVLGPRIEPTVLTAMGLLDTLAVDECVRCGMLAGQDDLLTFRHELARHAILEIISPAAKVELHRAALRALCTASPGYQDAARLAHHAAGAGDRAAILEYATAAARQAAVATAHREAAKLYGLALRCADQLDPVDRAALFEAYSWECNVIDRRTEAIASGRTAAALRQQVADIARQAQNLARLVPMLLRVGETSEAERCSREAVRLLEPLPRGAEFALACRTQALVALARRDSLEAIRWGERAIELAEQCDDADVAGMTGAAVGSAWAMLDYERGREYLEACLRRALELDHPTHAANAYAHLGLRSSETYHLNQADRYLAEGIVFTEGRDLDTFHLLLLACRSLTLMYLGRWSEAASLARNVLRHTGMSAVNRLPALIALGRLYARADLADASGSLDEALAVARPIGSAETIGLVRAARAEAAWLAGDAVRTLDEACAGYEVAVRERHAWVAGELAYWQSKAGHPARPLDWLAEPFALQLAGDGQAAAAVWRRLGCPYEEARTLADGDDAERRAALEIWQQLGARTVALSLGRALRAAGLARVPRGPYNAARANRFGLTLRQADVLDLLIADLSNAEIAERLSIAPKTVDHHVAAVLAKLDVPSRKAAAALAREHGTVSAARRIEPGQPGMGPKLAHIDGVSAG